jgi:hypothetical protein
MSDAHDPWGKLRWVAPYKSHPWGETIELPDGTPITVEELYQAFAVRFIHELPLPEKTE